MNSEKVKEIKEALKQNDDNGILYEVDYKKRTCKFIHHEDILTLINELESENKELRNVISIANEREYRKKFTDEWRKEYQKELDKQGNGHIAGHPDFDLVYKLYFEQKDRIAELEKENALIKNSVAMRDYKTLEEISNNKVKQFAERLKEQMNVREYMGVKYKQGVFSENDIDETLKEYEK